VTSQASRSASIANSRMTLQERLAASVAKSRTGSPKTVMSGDEGGTSSVVSTRDSGEITALDVNGSPGKTNGSISPVGSPPPLQLPASPVKVDVSVLEDKDIPLRTETPDLQVITGEEIMIQSPATVETPKQDDLSLRVSSEPLVPESPQQTQLASPLRLSTTSLPPDSDPATTDILTTLRTELANAESRRLEESQQSTDRINALEQKLKLLSQTTLAHTREISADTTAGTWEKKLADREEKIALLLDEGEKLAKIELTLMTTIKTLRTKQKEDASALSSALSRAEKAEKQLVEVKAQLKKANEIEKKNTERLKAMYKIETANEALKRERDAAQVTIASLQSALEEAVTRADEAESKVQTEALEKERTTNVELQEKLDRLTTESSLAEDRYKSEIADLKGRLEKEQLSAKSMQIDLSTEINVPSLCPSTDD
jgi:TATA element modulatory factor